MRPLRPALLLLTLVPAIAFAGGSAENAVLVVDPGRDDALAVANAYVEARDLPDANLLFMRPLDGGSLASSAERQLSAFAHELVRRGQDGHVAFVVLAPGADHRAAAGGLLTDGCHPVGHLSATSVYAVQPFVDEVLAGSGAVTWTNPYFDVTGAPRGLDPSTGWTGGAPDDTASGRRLFVASLLGHTGTRGNTVSEIRTMIARSAAADGTFPAGTFSFHRTGDAARSGPRHDHFPAVRTALEALGASTVEDVESVPKGRHDVLGCMTGAAYPKVATEDFTILPGAFCDHLTSWAADFDRADQTKVSAWIARGASLTAGAVEEPCNYPGKFPRPELHLFAFQGLTLGEAYLRSTEYVPFQALLYGDPLTRPFAHVPAVGPIGGIGGIGGTVSGAVDLALSATTTHATADIGRFVILVDGRRLGEVEAANGAATFRLDTAGLDDGVHDLRVLAEDDSLLRTAGRRVEELVVDHYGRSVTAVPLVLTGDLGTRFVFRLTAAGGDMEEVRLLHGSRVVASASASGSEVAVHGRMLGAGRPRLFAEATFRDGRRARSGSLTVEVADGATGSPAGTPVVFDAILPALDEAPRIVELPASFPHDFADATYEIVDGPEHGAVLPGGAGPFRLIRAAPDAPAVDRLTFRVTTPGGTSRTATLRFGHAPAVAPIPVRLVDGVLRDRRRAGRDKLRLDGVLDLPAGGEGGRFDPATDPLRLAVGDPDAPLVVDIPEDDPAWRRRRGRWKIRSAAGARPRWRVRVDPLSGALRVVVDKLDLDASPATVRLAVETDAHAGSASGTWSERRRGRYRLAE